MIMGYIYSIYFTEDNRFVALWYGNNFKASRPSYRDPLFSTIKWRNLKRWEIDYDTIKTE